MNDKFTWLINESCCFSDSSFIESLNKINQVLDSIIYQDDTYSYQSYRALLILNHNYRSFLNPNYLQDKNNLSFLKYQMKSYYARGGTEEIIPYLSQVDSLKEFLLNAELEGKEQFVVQCFIQPFRGIPNELKKFCEVPDFYPTIPEDVYCKIYQKK